MLNTIGQIFADLQRYEEALASYADALATLAPPGGGGAEAEAYSAKVHCSVAKCHQCLGRYDEVAASYRRALAIQRVRCVGREELDVAQVSRGLCLRVAPCGGAGARGGCQYAPAAAAAAARCA